MHELGHVLGLLHTISRPDRDQYIKIYPKCIPENRMNDFRKVKEFEANTHGIPYMCNSIMHYPNYEYFPCPVMTRHDGLKCENDNDRNAA